MKVIKKIHTPIGNIITHKSPGGTETHEKTGLLGVFDLVKAIKDDKDKINKKKDVKDNKKVNKKGKSINLNSLFNENYTIKSPRTRKFLGNAVWMRSPGGLPAPVAYFDVHNGGNGMTEVHRRILKILRKALDKKPVTSRNVRNLNKNVKLLNGRRLYRVSYNKTVSPYTPLDYVMPHRKGGNMEKEMKEATKKRQRTLSMPMSREKYFPEYALKALKDAKALRKIRGLMRGKRFDAKKMSIHPTKTSYHMTVPNKYMKVVGTYKRPSAAKIYKGEGPMVRRKVFAIPQPPNGKRVEYKQLCLRQVKNKKQAYFAPIGTCLD